MAVQFLFDPFDADLDQRDEVKVCMEQFGKVLLGIIPVVRDDLCPSYAEYLQLFGYSWDQVLAYNPYEFESVDDCYINHTEQRLGERPSEKEITAALEREGQEILKAAPADAYFVALCVEGKQMPSEGMAELIAARENSGKPKLCFVIGGSFGLSPTVKSRADRKLSMSQMTFPHHLARVMLIEQVYRGFKINEGSQYHK